MKKKIISAIAASVLAIQAIAVPMMVNAEDTAKYISNSDFTDCAIGGNTGQGIYGLGVILDGSPWLSKGSASVHYQTYSRDEERGVNYCHMYSNSNKNEGDGAGSMYMYQRNLTAVNQIDPYGLVEFDVRIHEDSKDFNFMMGWFEDPTSSGFSSSTVALTLRFGPNGVTATNGSKVDNLAKLTPEKWYKVRVTTDNKFEEYAATVTDIETGKVIGSVTECAYSGVKPDGVKGIKITCFGYIRNNSYNYDLTNVTIARSNDKYSVQ